MLSRACVVLLCVLAWDVAEASARYSYPVVTSQKTSGRPSLRSNQKNNRKRVLEEPRPVSVETVVPSLDVLGVFNSSVTSTTTSGDQVSLTDDSQSYGSLLDAVLSPVITNESASPPSSPAAVDDGETMVTKPSAAVADASEAVDATAVAPEQQLEAPGTTAAATAADASELEASPLDQQLEAPGTTAAAADASELEASATDQQLEAPGTTATAAAADALEQQLEAPSTTATAAAAAEPEASPTAELEAPGTTELEVPAVKEAEAPTTTTSSSTEEKAEAEVLLRASDMQCTVIHKEGASGVTSASPKWVLTCYDIPKRVLDAMTFSSAHQCRIVDGVHECSAPLRVAT
jgi:hypothetical protein